MATHLVKQEYVKGGISIYICHCGKHIDPVDDHKYTFNQNQCTCQECIEIEN